MSDAAETKGASGATAAAGGAGGAFDMSSSAARTAIAATSMLLVLLTVVGLVLLMMRRQRTEDLDDHYSRMAAHLAEEVERRLESQRAVADTLAQAVPVLDAAITAGRTLTAAEANAKRTEAAASLVERMAVTATDEAIQQRAVVAKSAVGSAKDAANEALRVARAAAEATQAAERVTAAAKTPKEARSAGDSNADARDVGRARQESATARQRATEATKHAEQTADDANAALHATEVDAKKWLTQHGAAVDEVEAPSKPRETSSKLAAAAPALKKALADLESSRTAVEAAKRDLERSGGMPSYRKFGNDCLATSPTELYLCFTRALLREVLHSPASWDIVPCMASRPRAGVGTFVLFPVTAAAAGQLCLRVPLSSGLEGADGDETIGTGDRNFDEVVLVDRRDGAVLFSEGRDSQARMGTLAGFDAKSMGASRRNMEVEIGSSRYRVFLQPLLTTVPLLGPTESPATDPLPTSKAKEDSVLLLAGLVREARFGTELYQVRPTLFLWAAAMVAIAVFCWPLAKLWLVGPRTRFGRFDAAFLATSAVIATALSALLCPMLLAQAGLGQRLDRQLGDVADRISARLTEQIGSAVQALDAFIAQTTSYREVLSTSDDRSRWPQIRAACEALASQAKGAPAPQGKVAGLDPPPSAQLSEVTYLDDERRWPFCELVNAPPFRVGDMAPPRGLSFWVNREGLQQLKSVTAQQGTPAVAVASRNYFQRAVEGKAHPLGPGAEGEGPAPKNSVGVPEVVRSVTSSKKVLLVARATTAADKVTGVAAVEMEIGALRAPVLPKAFQMAVLRSDGTVMLHSKLDAHHGHSFFEDLGGRAAGELKALMTAETSGEIDARYRGTPSRLRVQLDPGTGWFVVVIASQGLLDVVVTDTALSTLACLGIFAVLLGAMAAVAAIVRASRAKLAGGPIAGHVLSLRPHARFSSLYATAGLRLAIAAGALSAVTMVFGCFVPTTLLVLAALALAVWAILSIPGLWREMRIPPRHPDAPPSWRDDLPIAFALSCFGLASVFIIFPTTVFFVGAHCTAVGNLLRAEQEHYRANLEDRPSCLTPTSDDKLAVDPCPDVIWPADMKRVPAQDGLASAGWFSSPILWPAATLTDSLRLYTSAKYDTALLGRASADARPPPRRSWARSGSTLHLQPVTRSWALESDLPRLLGFDRWWWPALVVLLFIALTAGANTVSYQSIQRLFFTDVLTERKGAAIVKGNLTPDALAQELLPAGNHCQILVIHPPCDLAAKLGEDKRFAPLSEHPSLPSRTIPFIGDLEPLLANPAWSDRVRQTVSTAPALLLSGVDPLRQGPPDQRRRWALTLKDFRVVSGPGRPGGVSRAKGPCSAIAGEQPSDAALSHDWTMSDDDEQRVLGQLAIDGYASPNPHNAPTLRHLAARGLLDADTLTLRDDDFRDFLRRTVSSDDLHAWQSRETAVAWRAVRLPLSVGVTILLVLLGVSRPDLAETGALLPPVAAGLPVLLRVLAAMASGKKSVAA